MVDIKSKKVDFVSVVDSEGNPIPGFAHPVPESWIGTHLLPHGAKAHDGESDSDGDDAPDQGAIDEAVKAATTELEAQVADLTKQLKARDAADAKAKADADADAAAKKASTAK